MEGTLASDQQRIVTPDHGSARSRRLRRFLEHLQRANMDVATALEKGYTCALAILAQEAYQESCDVPVFEAERMELAAEMLATVSGELGMGMHPWLWPEQMREATASGDAVGRWHG